MSAIVGSGSQFSCDMLIPPGAIGEVLDQHQRNGLTVFTLRIDGVGVATSVPAGEVAERS